MCDPGPHHGEAIRRTQTREKTFLVVTSFTRCVHEVDAIDPHQALERWARDHDLTGYLPRWSAPSGEAQVFDLQSGEIMERAAVMPADADVLSEVVENA